MNNFVIQDMITKVSDSLNTITEAKKKQLYKSLDIEVMEKAQYFELNSQMFANQTIDLNTSQYIYNSLKGYSDTTLPERIVITKLMMELLQKRIKSRKNKLG